MSKSASVDLDSDRNFGLDVVRAVAISLVLLAHFAKPLDFLGIYGVELFFVLSGYLIGGILFRQFDGGSISRANLSLFWKRRWYRTLPNYYLFLLVSLILLPAGRFNAKITEYFVFLQNFAWPIDGFYSVSWSLAVEEWFYLLFPLAVFLLNRLGAAVKTSFVIAIAVFMAVPVSLRLLQTPGSDWEFQTRMVVIYRLDALMYGVGLVLLKSKNIWPQRTRMPLLALGSGLIGISAILLWPGRNSGGIPTAPALLFSIIPLGVALMLPVLERIPRPKSVVGLAIQRVSEWSYSIYLCHIPVLFTLYAAVGQESLSGVSKLVVKVAALASVLFVSRTLYVYFELPITRLRPRLPPRQTADALQRS